NSRGSSWGDRRSQGRGNNANGSSRGGRWTNDRRNTGGPSRGGGRSGDSWDTWPVSNDIEGNWDGEPDESDVRSEGTGVTNLPGGGDTRLATTTNVGPVREDTQDRRDGSGNSSG
ncbi:unnamed protein product, partial [Allacma fusca]